MSIVIASFDPTGDSVFYADRKWVKIFPNGETHSEGEIEKVFWVTETIACGFTGIAPWGIGLATELVNSVDSSAFDLIEIIKAYPYPDGITGSTFILMGIYDDDKPFIFARETDGECTFERNRTVDAIATSPDEYNKNCQDFFINDLELNGDLDQACINTIKFASIQNPKYISETYNVIRIPYSGI